MADLSQDLSKRLQPASDRPSEDRYRALIQALDDGFCVIEVVFDKTGRPCDYIFRDINAAFSARTGMTDVLDRSVVSMLPKHEQFWFDFYGRIAMTGESARVEHRAEALDRWFEAFGFRVGAPGENLVGVLFRDINERKAFEETLQTRIAERTAELEQAHENLRQAQKMEAVGQLTGGIAHDFNNLLQGVTGSLELLKRHLAAGRTTGLERFIDNAMKSAHRAASLTHRLLAFSRRQPLAPMPLAVPPLVASMEELLLRTLGEHIDLDVVMAPDLWPTRCDPNQLENALLNLCINARDAMPEGGVLSISAANVSMAPAHAAACELPVGDYVNITVADSGAGMSEAVMTRAFDPFFTTKQLGEGTGLGLSMIYGFARQSGGSVKIESTLGAGTKVSLFLPRTTDPVPPMIAAGSEQASPMSALSGSILLVEDDERVRSVVAETLADQGYPVVEAADGPAGLAVLESGRQIDVLITDVGLPGMSGLQLVKLARILRPELRVLIMTGYAEGSPVIEAVRGSNTRMITKPFAIGAFTRCLHELLQT